MSCACRQATQVHGYFTDIWSMTPRLELSTTSGPVEIIYDNGAWTYNISDDTDIQKLRDSATQLELQKKCIEDKIRSIEEECRKKERAIELILHSNKCTAVPRKKTTTFTAALKG